MKANGKASSCTLLDASATRVAVRKKSKPWRRPNADDDPSVASSPSPNFYIIFLHKFSEFFDFSEY